MKNNVRISLHVFGSTAVALLFLASVECNSYELIDLAETVADGGPQQHRDAAARKTIPSADAAPLSIPSSADPTAGEPVPPLRPVDASPPIQPPSTPSTVGAWCQRHSHGFCSDFDDTSAFDKSRLQPNYAVFSDGGPNPTCVGCWDGPFLAPANDGTRALIGLGVNPAPDSSPNSFFSFVSAATVNNAFLYKLYAYPVDRPHLVFAFDFFPSCASADSAVRLAYVSLPNSQGGFLVEVWLTKDGYYGATKNSDQATTSYNYFSLQPASTWQHAQIDVPVAGSAVTITVTGSDPTTGATKTTSKPFASLPTPASTVAFALGQSSYGIGTSTCGVWYDNASMDASPF